jgi:hypothetical protein
MGGHVARLARKEDSSFLKKRSKKLLSVRLAARFPGSPNVERNGKIFLVLFFKKENLVASR